MKKIFVIFAAFGIMSMGACFSPWDGSGEQGSIVINLGNGGARYTMATGDTYTIILTSPGETSISQTIAGGTASFSSVPAGPWNILVHADNNGQLKGYGETDVEVKAGATASASVTVKDIGKSVTTEVSTWDKLKEVFEKNTGQNEVVIIKNSFEANDSMNLPARKWNITLWAEGPVKITQNQDLPINSLFRVLPGCELTLGGNITISGGNHGTHSLFVVQNNGNLIMYDGVILTENNATTSLRGGGVTVDGGAFTMNGGVISKNTTSTAGGGVRVLSGSFTKTGGTIYGYTETNSNSNRATGNQGHAVYFDKSPGKNKNTTVGPQDKFINGSWTQ